MKPNGVVKFGSQSKIRQNFWNIAGISEQQELLHAEDRERIPAGYGRVYFGGNNSLTESGLSDVNNPVNCCGGGGVGGSAGSFPSIDKPSPLAPCNELISIEKINEIIERNDNICDVKNTFVSGVTGFSQTGADLDINITCVGDCVLPPEVCPTISKQHIKIYMSNAIPPLENCRTTNGELVYQKNVVDPAGDLAAAKAIAEALFGSLYRPLPSKECCFSGLGCQEYTLQSDYERKIDTTRVTKDPTSGCVSGLSCGANCWTHYFSVGYEKVYDDVVSLCGCNSWGVSIYIESGHVSEEFNHTQINPPSNLRKEVLNFRNGIFYDACNEMHLIKCKSIYDSEGKEYVVRADSISDLNKLFPFLDKDPTLYGMSNTITIKSEIGIVVINGMTGEVIYSIKNEGRKIN